MAEAGARQKWRRQLVLAALLLGAGTALPGQPSATESAAAEPTGSLTGRLTDLHSAPLDGATVIIRNEATGEEAQTVTGKGGAYRFSGLGAGEYTLVAESQQLGRGTVEGILIGAGQNARVQTAIQFEFPPPHPIQIVFHDIQPERAPVTTELATERLEPVALFGLHLPDWQMPPAETPQLAASFESEPLQTVPVMARSWPALAPPRSLPIAKRPEAEDSAGLNPVGATPASTEALGAPQKGAKPGKTLETEAAEAKAPAEGSALMARPKPCPVTEQGLFEGCAAPEGSDLSATPAAGAALAAGATGAAWTGEGGAVLLQAAAGALRAAMQFAQSPEKPILAVFRAPEPAAAAETTTLPASQVQALPASGRRWQDFVLDAPAGRTSDGGEGNASLGGSAPGALAISLDGVPRGLAFGGQGGAWARGTSMAGPGMSEAAIREVNMATGNVEAEGARAAGGRIDVESQRGGNGLHGQGFFFDRSNLLGTQNPFTEWVKETTPATALTVPVFTAESYTPPDRETTWGFGLGRHIRRDKLFWFAAIDSYQRNDPGLGTVKHPDQFFAQPADLQMQALASRMDLSSTNPVAAGLGVYSPMLETLAGLLGPAPRTATQWTGFARLDWEAAERHRFTLEGTGARWNSAGGGLTRTSEPYGNHSFGSSRASEEWLLGRWEAFVTPNLLAVTQASVGHTVLGAPAETPSAFEQTLLGPNAWGRLPQMIVDARYGFTIGNPARFGAGKYPDEHLIEGQESVDWVRGGLLVKAGFNLGHNADATSLLRNQTGTYYYANVENFVSDTLVFGKYGLGGELNPAAEHNCDQTGKAWQDQAGQPRGLGALPCYSYYSQTMGPTDWRLSTNDWAGYATTQWQPKKGLTLSAGLRWEREQLPPALAALHNPELSLTQKLPSLGNNWGPRFSLAWGTGESHWPVLRLGYGFYFGRVENSTVETALTQTGSLNGDLNFFLRPLEGFDSATNTSDAPPFPYVLQGPPPSVVKPGAVEFAPGFRNPEVHQAVAGVEETLPGRVQIAASAAVSLGRRLPISIDTNINPLTPTQTLTYSVIDGTGKGPIKATQLTVPFYASWPGSQGTCPYYEPASTGVPGRPCPDYQQITQIESRANSTYEAAMIRVSRYARRGLSLHAHYTYSHAMDWNPNESTQVAGNDVLDPAHFGLEYGTGNMDARHYAAALLVWEAPWKLHSNLGRLANGWMLSGIGQYRSGLPYTMRTAGSLPEEFEATNGDAIVGLGPSINGSGGDNRVYGLGNDKVNYNMGRNTFRYPATWKADTRIGRRFELGHQREVELLAESFNLFNHQNVTEIETTGYSIEPGDLTGTFPTLRFLNGLKADTTAFGQPLNINATNFYRQRQIQVGLRMRF